MRRKARNRPPVADGRRRDAGYSLTELIAVVIILGILAAGIIPMTKMSVARAKELELQRCLRDMRRAIDLHKKMADEQKIEVEATGTGYPETLEMLVEGVKLKDKDQLFKFLRRIPRDPFTGEREWGLRGSQDDPDADSWDGEDVFDVYSLSEGMALDGSMYREW